MTNTGFIEVVTRILGRVVVEVDGEYFVSDEFRPADGDSPRHTLVGKDVTNVASLVPQLDARDVSAQKTIESKLENLPRVSREWCKSYRWKAYLPK